jgi:osomolarity two-component system response regulator SKN7
MDDSFAAQQLDLVNTQLAATQQQLQHLSDRYQDLAQGHVVLLQQVLQLQKIAKGHDGVMHRVMGFLHSVDASQRRNSRIAAPFGNSSGMGGDSMPNDGTADDHPASPLQQASELLDEFSAENLPNKELEQLTHDFHLRNDYSTPPSDPSGSMAHHGDGSRAQLGYPIGNDLDNMVYPVGHTNGIDPINSEHIHNIPYALPANGMLPIEHMPEMVPESSVAAGKKKVTTESIWGINKPRILLVEDDRVCARIGSKFLQAFECGVETARDGLEAVNKINNGAANSFDLILMDIIMPHLDGVSATVCIREIRPAIPIIAMTSNIRADDIDMYFRYGMNDVLPKPFTKEGMLKALEKHLPQFKKNATFPPPGQMSHPGSFAPIIAPNQPLGLNMGQLSAAPSLKDETSPGKSPATASSWHSPNQITGASPIIGSTSGSYLQQPMDNRSYNMTTQHPQTGFAPPQNAPMVGQRPAQHRRVMSDMTTGSPLDDRGEKRQRVYPPAGYPQ